MSQGTSDQAFSMHSSQTWRPNRTGVLLIHGLTGSPTEMSPLDKALRRAGYRTAVPLIAGHGAGHEELLATTWQDWRDGLRRDLHELARTCDAVIIVGLCVGGLLGVLLAADEEKVQGLVSLSPDLNFRVPGPGTPWTRFLLPLAYRVPWLMRHGYWTQKPPYGLQHPRLRRRVANAVAESVRGQTKDFGTFRMYAGTFLQLERLQETTRQHLPRVHCPALVMHSFEDSLFSIRNATVMYHRLGSLKKELALITGCDHVMTVDWRKEDVARRVIRFIAGRHGAFIEDEESDEESYACEISPRPPVDPAQRAAHHLIIRKGKTEQLVLQLWEDGDPQTAGVPFRRWDQSPRGGELQTEWQLARTAINALAFGLKKRLSIGTNPDGSVRAAPAWKTSQPTPMSVLGEPTRA